MDRSRIRQSLTLLSVAASLAAPRSAAAADYRGQVTFGGLPLPGATITATLGTKKFTTVSDPGGVYRFEDLSDGSWTITVEMQCFTTAHGEVTIASNRKTAAGQWELTLLPPDQLMARAQVTPLPANPSPTTSTVAAPGKAAAPANTADLPKPSEDSSQHPSDGFLVNGSSNNAARSQFALDQSFGNSRTNTKNLYTGGLEAILDNSAFNARPYSIAGLDTPKAAYNRITGIVTLGGPLNLPHLMRHGPTFFVAYQWTRDHTASTLPALVPTEAERAGDLSGLSNSLGQPPPIYDPTSGLPFAGNIVPVSPQAAALLQFYPLPNLTGNPSYNYQAAVLDSNHQDVVQSRLDKTFGRKDEVFGRFDLQSTRASSTSLFGFVDTTDTLGLDTNIHWSHRFSQHLFLYTGYRLSRLRTHVTPNFEDRVNVAGDAGITGNDQDPTNWGPPTLAFSSGIASLTDAQSSFNRNRTDAFSGSVEIYHRTHNITLGGDLRKQQYNDFFQQDPRGTFTFTGAATQQAAAATTGSDLADFLLGVPDTSSIAFGNADKYLRQPVYDLFATDDWRLLPVLSINVGMRWEYGAPITELKDRLVNLDLAPGFTAASPVLASDPTGSLTGSRYPTSLVRPDKLGFEPRIGISWRPIPASTIVVRAGYGVYHDTSVYLTSALQLAQQAPLSKSLNVENSAACPLTLADGFNACASTTPDTFALDPNFRVGYAQTWQLAIQRDLPAALQLTATYLGVKGTRGVQQILPNTYPIGASNPCPACPIGFVYRTSNGDSTRESAQLQLRRRLRSGFTASLLYTFSKSVDDDAVLGGQGHVTATSETQSFQTTPVAAATAAIAQNWHDPQAERALSTFDQRHLLNLTAQYTTGQGAAGGTLMTGWRGRILKEWTALTQITAGSGLPETPTYLAAVPGTAYTSVIRPNLTGSPIYTAHANTHLNAAAYTAPLSGQWGTAARDSITGPRQFTLDAALARTFRPDTRFFLDARLDATNLLNHAVFTGWDTIVNSSQFGTPASANPMRSLQITLRLRF